MSLPPLGLYIHLPWCERKCPYCDFNSHEYDELPESAYIDALLKDLEDDLSLVQNREIETLFIGGGTPSLFSAAGIARLLSGVKARVACADDMECTMEANPGSAEADKFCGFQQAGINRLSIGIQSFDEQLLSELGRVHNVEQAHSAIEFARAAQFASFNIDLMHGLPGQTHITGAKDLETAIAYQPPHLSWYQLTIEANTVFHKRPPSLPIEDELAEIQDNGEELLQTAGYERYEVSAFSQPSFQCQHNENYWLFGDYLGIGAGAHAKITFADGRIERRAKRKQPDQYLASKTGEFAGSIEQLSKRNIVAEFMMNALRRKHGFSVELFCERTGLQVSALEPQLDKLIQRGLLKVDNNCVATTTTGQRYLDNVVAEFLI